MQAFYKEIVVDDGKMIISFLPIQKQPDSYNCSLFAFAVEVLDGNHIIDAVFDFQDLWTHLIQYGESKNLVSFSKRNF